MKHISFDIEISDAFELKPGEDLLKYAPFHISVAAAMDSTGASKLWHSTGEDGKPAVEMNREGARELLAYLAQMQQEGWNLFAWNGLSFDLRWIGYNAGRHGDGRGAWRWGLYDPMFQFFQPARLSDRVGRRGRGHGDPADQAHERGGCAARVAQREPPAGDGLRHRRLPDHEPGRRGNCAARRAIRWRTKKGTLSSEPMPRFKTVAEILREPEPDQSWMTAGGMKRSGFIEWLPGSVLSP